MNKLNKLLLSEMRIIEGNIKSEVEISKDAMKKALIDEENLKALGFVLKKDHLVNLASDYTVNPKLIPLYVRVQEFEPAIKVSPMYPNFPIQVLEMREMEYRLNQALHYMTTYGVKQQFGFEVTKGWLPETEEMERVEDEQVASMKTLDYLDSHEVNSVVIYKLAGKKERLLPNEVVIVQEIVKRSNRLIITEIPFKENIGAIYGEVLLNGGLHDRYRALSELEYVMKHPGDVLDLVEQLVVLNRYKHFKTSLKRGLVELIEKFSISALEENLASNRWSKTFLGKGGKLRAINRNIALIDYLSYNKFSKNPESKEVVTALKSGELYSFNQRLEAAYKNNDLELVTSMLKSRPGIYFRQINRLMKNGVPLGGVLKDMSELGVDLKTQSIVSAINNFDGDELVESAFFKALESNLASKNIEKIAGKKVYVDSGDVVLESSVINLTDKFEEGGYIQNGIALRIPENADFIRFFTYWNHNFSIDIDLHASYSKTNGERATVGWNSHYKNAGVVHSGDITHSDAAEYVDIDMKQARESGVDKLQFNINSYSRVPFKDIDTVFCGIMLLGKMGQKVELYSQKNTLFRHDLDNNSIAVDYAYIDFESNTIQIVGKQSESYNDKNLLDGVKTKLPISTYLNILFALQRVELVENKEDADVIIGFAKSDDENYLSLVDENYFMGY